ncbi:MAG: phage capsid protein [Alphaproteobacteria bacterium]
MSFDVSANYTIDFAGVVSMRLQQRGSKLRRAVMESKFQGKAAKAVDQVGPVTAQKRTSRHADTPLISTPHSARWIYPTDYEWADLIDHQDKLRTIAEPTNAYVENGSNALGRAIDDEVIAAFFGPARTGENGDESTPFDAAGQTVAADVGAGGSTGLNVAKLRAAKRILMANEVDVDYDPLFCAITARQHDDLLSETQAVSLDFNTRPVLVDGKITAFMGFNFIHIERIGVDGSALRRVPVWAKSGMHLGLWDEIEGKVTERDDKSYATQVYVRGTFGATRTEEGKVVEIKCDES